MIFITHHKNNFLNKTAISSSLQIIELIRDHWCGNTIRKLILPSKATRTDIPYIEIQHFGGAYDEYSGSDYYFVSEELAKILVEFDLVKGTPQWGYTDQNILKFNDCRTPYAVSYKSGKINKFYYKHNVWR